MSFPELLVRWRVDRGLSQEQLAEAAGVSVRAISNLERGTTRPRRGTARSLADGLGLTDDDRAAFLGAADTATDPRVVATRPGPDPVGNLPAPLTSIIGRQREITALVRLVRPGGQRAVTVTGPGGVGKSRLALEVAWQVAGRFERADAVDASPLRGPDELATSIADALGCPPGVPAAARIGSAPRLLLLDSLEHVTDAAGVLADLLVACPRLCLLMTSRSPVGVPGEQPSALGPLAVPMPGDDHTVTDTPAGALLVDRTRAVRPDFAPTDTRTLAALCRRLDGLPLAIELAAVRLGAEPPADVLAQLADRSVTLRADAIDVPGRHRTLRATVEWSTGRLPEADRLVLATLGAFRGTSPVTMVRRVLATADLPVESFDASLASLAAASLITIATGPTGTRVQMLDTIREVAADLLVDGGHDRGVRDAHARHLLDLVRSGDADGDADNVRGALEWALAHLPAAFDVPAVDGLYRHFTEPSRFAEGYRVLSAVAAVAVDPVIRAYAQLRAAAAADMHGRHEVALALAAEAGAAFDRLGITEHRASLLALVGNAHKSLGELQPAFDAYQESLRVAELSGNERYVMVGVNNLGTVAHDLGRFEEAAGHYSHSLRLRQVLGDERGAAVCLVNLGILAHHVGDVDRGVEQLVAAAARFRALDEPYGAAFALAALAQAQLAAGAADDAARSAREALDVSVRSDHPGTRAMAEAALGDVAAAAGRIDEADRYYATALEHTTERFEVVRLCERLSAVRARTDPDGARELLARADGIRRTCGYEVAPVERAALAATRRLLGVHAESG